jgi:hypothetical protein
MSLGLPGAWTSSPSDNARPREGVPGSTDHGGRPLSGLLMPPFLEWYREGTGGNHATHHLLRTVDRHLAVLDGQRNLGSGLWRPQVDAACRCMLRILRLKRCSDSRIY